MRYLLLCKELKVHRLGKCMSLYHSVLYQIHIHCPKLHQVSPAFKCPVRLLVSIHEFNSTPLMSKRILAIYVVCCYDMLTLPPCQHSILEPITIWDPGPIYVCCHHCQNVHLMFFTFVPMESPKLSFCSSSLTPSSN